MHSTVQTGVFNPHNNEYNHHSAHYHPPPHMYHYQPNPHHLYSSHHPNLHQQHDNNNNNNNTKSHLNHHGASSSANVSLLAVNSTSTENLGNELSHSASSIARGRSELSVSNPNLADKKRRNSAGSTSSGPPQVNASFNYLVTKGHETQPNSHVKRNVQSFWQCTRPCGVLTFIVGVFLLIASIFGFLLFLEQNLCHLIKTCSNSLVKIGTITSLVIGVVLTLVGAIIVVYVKKDGNADIIITSSKNVSIDQSEIRKMQEIKNNYLLVAKANKYAANSTNSQENKAATVNLMSVESKNEASLNI